MNAQIHSFTPGKLTVDDWRAMDRDGLLDETKTYELIDGVLYEMPPDSPEHIDYSIVIGRLLYSSLAPDIAIVPGSSLVLDQHNAPRPDWYIFPRAVATADLRGADVLLAIEQAKSSLSRDLKKKASLYARFGIREYWVIGISKRQVHVRRDPTPRGYQTNTTHDEADEAIEASLIPGLTLRLADLERI